VPKLTTPIDADFSAFPQRLALAMKESGMTQRQAAEAAGIQSSTITRADGDRLGGISANQIVRLAKALSVRVGWLLVGEEPMRQTPGGAVTLPMVFIEKAADAHNVRSRPKRNRP
jgi:transcriptional regulator with XRE-family HTH domain